MSSFGITFLDLDKCEKSSITNTESRSSIISPANSSPLNNLTMGNYLELLSSTNFYNNSALKNISLETEVSTRF